MKKEDTEIEVYLVCLRCGHRWPRRIWDRDPYVCPKCKSHYWNKPKHLNSGPPRKTPAPEPTVAGVSKVAVRIQKALGIAATPSAVTTLAIIQLVSRILGHKEPLPPELRELDVITELEGELATIKKQLKTQNNQKRVPGV